MSERLITEGTLKLLCRKRDEITEHLQRLGSDRSGDQRASMHDEPGIENTKNLLRRSLARIGDLSRIKIIRSRKEVNIVDIGNRVLIGFEDGYEELMALLGPDDAIYRTDLASIVSSESPLGKAIRGKRKNEEATFNLSRAATRRVKILDILEGEF